MYTLYYFPAKKRGEKQKRAKYDWKPPIFAKICSLEFRICLYLDQQILKILTQIQLDNQGFFNFSIFRQIAKFLTNFTKIAQVSYIVKLQYSNVPL